MADTGNPEYAHLTPAQLAAREELLGDAEEFFRYGNFYDKDGNIILGVATGEDHDRAMERYLKELGGSNDDD